MSSVQSTTNLFCFSLFRWNNHQPNFISVFSSLLLNETLVDVTLAAEGRQLQAHKVVLSACSSYFQVITNRRKAWITWNWQTVPIFSPYSQRTRANIRSWFLRMSSTTTLKQWWTSCTTVKWMYPPSNSRRFSRPLRCWRSKAWQKCQMPPRSPSPTASRAITPRETNRLAA